MSEIYIVGLGNPGKEYKNNRHNVGFLILEQFTKKYESKFVLKNKLKSRYSEIKHNKSTSNPSLVKDRATFAAHPG